MSHRTLFPKPTSVFVCGSNRPLLNWVAYALATASDAGFVWTDVHLADELPTPDDPLGRGIIPPDRLRRLAPRELAPDDVTANMAVSAVIRDDETPENLDRLLEFLRLPAATQSVLASTTGGVAPRVLVLSNGHRLVALYSDLAAVRPTVRAIVGAGVAMIMTFADAPPGARVAFDVVLHVDGTDPSAWRQARLRVERAPGDSYFQAGSQALLADVEPIASVLRREFP